MIALGGNNLSAKCGQLLAVPGHLISSHSCPAAITATPPSTGIRFTSDECSCCNGKMQCLLCHACSHSSTLWQAGWQSRRNLPSILNLTGDFEQQSSMSACAKSGSCSSKVAAHLLLKWSTKPSRLELRSCTNCPWIRWTQPLKLRPLFLSMACWKPQTLL